MRSVHALIVHEDTAMSKQIHLAGFALFTPAPHMPLSWIYPREKIRHKWYEGEYWEAVVRTLERGKFDMLFFADSLAGGTQPDQVRYAIQFPSHDPVALITYLSAIAKKLGFRRHHVHDLLPAVSAGPDPIDARSSHPGSNRLEYRVLNLNGRGEKLRAGEPAGPRRPL